MQVSHSCPSKEGGSTKEIIQIFHANVKILQCKETSQRNNIVVHHTFVDLSRSIVKVIIAHHKNLLPNRFLPSKCQGKVNPLKSHPVNLFLPFLPIPPNVWICIFPESDLCYCYRIYIITTLRWETLWTSTTLDQNTSRLFNVVSIYLQAEPSSLQLFQ